MSTKPICSAAANCIDLSAAALHIIAMALMLMDRLWATLLPAQDWLTCVGRLAFPYLCIYDSGRLLSYPESEALCTAAAVVCTAFGSAL